MCCHGEVMWLMSVVPAQRITATWHCTALANREWILEASKFIVGSSFSVPGNKANNWADYLYAEI